MRQAPATVSLPKPVGLEIPFLATGSPNRILDVADSSVSGEKPILRKAARGG